MADDAHAAGVQRRAGLPGRQQVLDDGVELLLRRVPRLEQVVVERDLVDRLDRGLGVGVGGEQDALGAPGRACAPATRYSVPAIPGMRWSAISSATWSPRVRSSREQLERLRRRSARAGCGSARRSAGAGRGRPRRGPRARRRRRGSPGGAGGRVRPLLLLCRRKGHGPTVPERADGPRTAPRTASGSRKLRRSSGMADPPRASADRSRPRRGHARVPRPLAAAEEPPTHPARGRDPGFDVLAPAGGHAALVLVDLHGGGDRDMRTRTSDARALANYVSAVTGAPARPSDVTDADGYSGRSASRRTCPTEPQRANSHARLRCP